MTNKEYITAYKTAHRLSGKLTIATKKELLKSFKEAAELAAKEVLRAEAGGLSDLTSAAWRQIDKQLQIGADIICNAAEGQIPQSITAGYNNYLAIDAEYITDVGSPYISDAGIKNMGIGVNFNLLEAQAARTYGTSGYNFSERIWNLYDTDGLPIGINGDYQYRIKNIILTGQAQGRDSVKIAEDIQLYVAQGKKAVFKSGRYGKLIPGTGEYRRRISRTVDWRALRLVRSEMNASLQMAGVMEGRLNPAATKMYNWFKSAGNPIDFDGSRNASGLRCIDLEDGNPYTEENVPSYNHPNCSCQVQPVLMNQQQFAADLQGWTPGSGPEYLDTWYTEQYLPVNV